MDQKRMLSLLNDQFGIPIKYRTLMNFEQWGLITPPQRTSGPQGKVIEYEAVSIAEIIAAWKMIHAQYLKPDELECYGKQKFDTKLIALARKAIRVESKKRRQEVNAPAGENAASNWDDYQERIQLEMEVSRNMPYSFQYFLPFLKHIWNRELCTALDKLHSLGIGAGAAMTSIG